MRKVQLIHPNATLQPRPGNRERAALSYPLRRMTARDARVGVMREKKLLTFNEVAPILAEHLGLGRDGVRRFMRKYGVRVGRKLYLHSSILEGLLERGRLPREEA
ncbi:hypothetical protein A0O31_01838 [Thermus brockianus]|nr:hypothetical protein A0O31_01838 [Thermus brockianus]